MPTAMTRRLKSEWVITTSFQVTSNKELKSSTEHKAEEDQGILTQQATPSWIIPCLPWITGLWCGFLTTFKKSARCAGLTLIYSEDGITVVCAEVWSAISVVTTASMLLATLTRECVSATLATETRRDSSVCSKESPVLYLVTFSKTTEISQSEYKKF